MIDLEQLVADWLSAQGVANVKRVGVPFRIASVGASTETITLLMAYRSFGPTYMLKVTIDTVPRTNELRRGEHYGVLVVVALWLDVTPTGRSPLGHVAFSFHSGSVLVPGTGITLP